MEGEHLYVLKERSRLCIEGGSTSGELYGEVTGAGKTFSKNGMELVKVGIRTSP